MPALLTWKVARMRARRRGMSLSASTTGSASPDWQCTTSQAAALRAQRSVPRNQPSRVRAIRCTESPERRPEVTTVDSQPRRSRPSCSAAANSPTPPSRSGG